MTLLIDINTLSSANIHSIFKKATHYSAHEIAHHRQTQTLRGLICVNLFFENSTRTYNSFQIAQNRHGMIVLAPDVARSALSKGETIQDTIRTFEAMGCSLFVIRHQESGLISSLVSELSAKTHLISAGSGTQHHPTQALIDLFTIASLKPNFSNLTVAIIGNITHSRVAHSLASGLRILGCNNLRTIAPANWQSPTISAQHFHEMQTGLQDVDVVVCLRVQKERMGQNNTVDLDLYQQQFCLTEERLAQAKPDAIVLHPGPINRGLEICSSVADGPQSMILRQASNSIPIRMAIIDYMFANECASVL